MKIFNYRSLIAAAGAAALVTLSLAPLRAATLTWSAGADILSTDPHAMNDTFSMTFLNNVYEGLVRHTDQLKIEPALATSWSRISPTVWRFKLRPNVTFQNGDHFSADDVVFSWQRANTPGGLIMSVINQIKDIRKVDDLTVDIETQKPFPILLSVLTYFYMMDKHWAEENGATASSDLTSNHENFAAVHANGTGPFKLVSRDIGVKTILAANPGWWDKPEHNLSQVTFEPIQSDATRTAALLSGAIDVTVSVPVQDIDRIEADPKLQVVQGPALRTIYFGMDMDRNELLYSDVKGKNPLKDIRIRRAIYEAIDIEAIKQKVMHGHSWPTGIIMSPYITGYPQGLNTRLPYDPAESRKLLAEAGYPNGFSVGLTCPNDRYVNDENICLAVVSMLAHVGIKIIPQIETRAKWIHQVNTLDVSMFMMGHAALPTADAYSTMSEAIATRTENQGGLNAGRYSNPKFDSLLDQVEQELDPGRRDALIKEAMTLVRDDIAFIPLHQQPVIWAAKKGIDLHQGPDDDLRLWYVVAH